GRIAVSPAALLAFRVTVPTTATVGIGFTSTITAVDAFGNTITSDNDTVTLSTTDSQNVGVSPAAVTLTNGTPTTTLNVATTDLGDVVRLTAADANCTTGSSGPIIVGGINTISDGGFEVPALPAGTWSQPAPGGSPWQFSATGAGISANGSTYT